MPWDDLDLPMPKTLHEQVAWSPQSMLDELQGAHAVVLLWGCKPCLPSAVLNWLQQPSIYCLVPPGDAHPDPVFPAWTADVAAQVWWDTAFVDRYPDADSVIFCVTGQCPRCSDHTTLLNRAWEACGHRLPIGCRRAMVALGAHILPHAVSASVPLLALALWLPAIA